MKCLQFMKNTVQILEITTEFVILYCLYLYPVTNGGDAIFENNNKNMCFYNSFMPKVY